MSGICMQPMNHHSDKRPSRTYLRQKYTFPLNLLTTTSSRIARPFLRAWAVAVSDTWQSVSALPHSSLQTAPTGGFAYGPTTPRIPWRCRIHRCVIEHSWHGDISKVFNFHIVSSIARPMSDFWAYTDKNDISPFTDNLDIYSRYWKDIAYSLRRISRTSEHLTTKVASGHLWAEVVSNE